MFGAAISLIKLFYMLKLSNEGIFNNVSTLLKGEDAEVPKK
jgi:hypothetical protein